MTPWELIGIVSAMAFSPDAPVAQYAWVASQHEAVEKEEKRFHQVVDRLSGPAVRDLRQGDVKLFFLLWGAVHRSEAPKPWKEKVAGNLEEAFLEFRGREEEAHGEDASEWVGFFELIFPHCDPSLVKKHKDFASLAPEHAFKHIMQDQNGEVVLWFNRLPVDLQGIYFERLKTGNALLRRMKREVNPEDIEVALIPSEPRVGIVERYLSHPFAHRLQPFYGKTFEQFIDWKILSPEELFENEEALIEAHPRQGMAYLDLARVYRYNKRYDEALGWIEAGLTLNVQTGNRLGCYLLEKTIILREADRIRSAREVFSEVPVKQLDRYNRDLRAEVEASLR